MFSKNYSNYVNKETYKTNIVNAGEGKYWKSLFNRIFRRKNKEYCYNVFNNEESLEPVAKKEVKWFLW